MRNRRASDVRDHEGNPCEVSPDGRPIDPKTGMPQPFKIGENFELSYQRHRTLSQARAVYESALPGIDEARTPEIDAAEWLPTALCRECALPLSFDDCPYCAEHGGRAGVEAWLRARPTPTDEQMEAVDRRIQQRRLEILEYVGPGPWGKEIEEVRA